jgi:hypothetical protein
MPTPINIITSYDSSTTEPVSIADSELPDLSKDVTYHFEITQTNKNGRQSVIHKTYGGEVSLTVEPWGSMIFYWGSSGNNHQPYYEYESLCPFVINKKYTITIIRNNATKTFKTYIDGKKTHEKVFETEWLIPKKSNFSLKIGEGYLENFQGKLENIKIYDSVLTEQQVLFLHEDVVEGFDNSLTDYYYQL